MQQNSTRVSRCGCSQFQSSPVPEDGCNWGILRHAMAEMCFNPHPSRRTGATLCAWNDHDRRPGFNPHPSRRTGATSCQCSGRSSCSVSILTRPGGRVQLCWLAPWMPTTIWFQSSPVPEDGCNSPCRTRSCWRGSVSILTRPGGRVQRRVNLARTLRKLVSILTRPGGRVQLPVLRRATQ